MSEMIKSRNRVKTYGEVFTPEDIIKDMCDMEGVRQSIAELDETVLDLCCGNGNISEEVISRKLEAAKKLGMEEYNKNFIKAVSSVYGIEIQRDNIEECRERIFIFVKRAYKRFTGHILQGTIRDMVRTIVDENFIWGDALKCVRFSKDENDIIHDNLLLISEWDWVGKRFYKKENDFALMRTEGNTVYSSKYTDVNIDSSWLPGQYEETTKVA